MKSSPILFLFILFSVLLLLSGCTQKPNGTDTNSDSNKMSDADFNAMIINLSAQCYQTCSVINADVNEGKWLLHYDLNAGRYICLCSKRVCADDPENPSIVYCQDENNSFPFEKQSN